MSLRDKTKEVFIRCEDCAETVVFMRHHWEKRDVTYEILVQDAFCSHWFCGIGGRLRRAWRAFWEKPVNYTGVYIEDSARVKQFLQDCMKLVEEDVINERSNTNS